MSKVYLGDGVYADTDGNGIILTTENGVGETNRIYLEPEVLHSFADYLETIKAGRKPA